MIVDHGHHHGQKKGLSLIPGLVMVAILKILSKKPIYGYAIYDTIIGLIEREIPRSLIYVSLRKLEKRGYVYSKWEASEQGPARRIYYITEEGKEALEHKLNCLKKYIRICQKIIDY